MPAYTYINEYKHAISSDTHKTFKNGSFLLQIIDLTKEPEETIRNPIQAQSDVSTFQLYKYGKNSFVYINIVLK